METTCFLFQQLCLDFSQRENLDSSSSRFLTLVMGGEQCEVILQRIEIKGWNYQMLFFRKQVSENYLLCKSTHTIEAQKSNCMMNPLSKSEEIYCQTDCHNKQ